MVAKAMNRVMDQSIFLRPCLSAMYPPGKLMNAVITCWTELMRPTVATVPPRAVT